MENSQNFGFRYRFNKNKFALVVSAKNRAEAEERVKAMASAELITDLHSPDEHAETVVVCQK